MKIDGVPPIDASPEQRQVVIIQYLHSIQNYAASIDARLRSINGMLIFFTIVLMLGLIFILIQGCSVLGL